MLDRRLKLGTFFGIGLYVHWTFALLIGFFAYQAREEGAVGIAFSIAIVLGVFFCVTLHEYGHALAARKFGIPTIDITLLPIGGVARLQRMPRIPWQELVVAVAGPAVNVVIAFLLAIGFLVAGVTFTFSGGEEIPADAVANTLFGEPSFMQFAFYMMAVNATLVVFNMIPAFPMDGGRVFRSILAMLMDYRKATVVASRVGLVCAVLMAGFALMTENPNPIPILIAVFIGFAGMSEAKQVEVTESVRGLKVHQVMVRTADGLPMDMPLWEIAARWQSTRATAMPVLSHAGTVVGMVRLQDISGALSRGVDTMATAAELIDRDSYDGTVGVDDDLESVILRVGHRGRQLPVVDANGYLVGVLDLNSMVLRGRMAKHLPDTDTPNDRFDAFS